MSGSGKAAAVLLAGRSNRVRMAWLGAVLALLGLLCALSVAIGTREVSFADILGGVSGRVETVAEAAVAVRLPRTVLALIAGAALGLAGLTVGCWISRFLHGPRRRRAGPSEGGRRAAA